MEEKNAVGVPDYDVELEERMKQIAVDHFRSFYADRNMDGVMINVSDDIHWIGSREYYVAHNKVEFEGLLRKHLDEFPPGCVMTVVYTEAAPLSPNCYTVTGELDIRIPRGKKMAYFVLRFSVIILYSDGDYRIVSIHSSVTEDDGYEEFVDDANGKPLRRMAEDMDDQGRYDALTGLYTLDYFKEEARRILDESDEKTKYALLCTDVAHFELVNNLYGLKKADRILSELATMLTVSSKRVELCCRSVADHFLLLVRYEEKAKLQRLVQGLCERFVRTIHGRYPEAQPKLGIGVYLISNSRDDVGQMVERANMARKNLRYQQKNNILYYDEEVFTRMDRVKKIEECMEEALKYKEFRVFLQPKYNLETGEIVGAEALCRWIRRDGSMVYPDEFIPIFEKNGFIANLDYYMLREVCRMIRRRLDAGKSCVPVSINQSRVLLKDPDYVKNIAGILKQYETPPEYIELELTERIFNDNMSDIAQMMKQLKEQGIHWSIDDFGTGYSSLNLLKDLPVDIIKIDKSFLDETETSEASKIIIRKTVELTRELDKTVICEGVETETQADYLRDIRCDMAQGYLYARPMPMKEFEGLLDTGGNEKE